MQDFYDAQELPLGFSMALAQNPTALEHFAALTPDAQEGLLSRAREVESKAEMRALIRELAHYS